MSHSVQKAISRKNGSGGNIKTACTQNAQAILCHNKWRRKRNYISNTMFQPSSSMPGPARPWIRRSGSRMTWIRLYIFQSGILNRTISLSDFYLLKRAFFKWAVISFASSHVAISWTLDDPPRTIQKKKPKGSHFSYKWLWHDNNACILFLFFNNMMLVI